MPHEIDACKSEPMQTMMTAMMRCQIVLWLGIGGRFCLENILISVRYLKLPIMIILFVDLKKLMMIRIVGRQKRMIFGTAKSVSKLLIYNELLPNANCIRLCVKTLKEFLVVSGTDANCSQVISSWLILWHFVVFIKLDMYTCWMKWIMNNE